MWCHYTSFPINNVEDKSKKNLTLNYCIIVINIIMYCFWPLKGIKTNFKLFYIG